MTVVLFAVSWLPFRGLLVCNMIASEQWLDIWYLLFAKTMIYLSAAMNPFLYNAINPRFCHAVKSVLFNVRQTPARLPVGSCPWKCNRLNMRIAKITKKIKTRTRTKNEIWRSGSVLCRWWVMIITCFVIIVFIALRNLRAPLIFEIINSCVSGKPGKSPDILIWHASRSIFHGQWTDLRKHWHAHAHLSMVDIIRMKL